MIFFSIDVLILSRRSPSGTTAEFYLRYVSVKFELNLMNFSSGEVALEFVFSTNAAKTLPHPIRS